MGYEKPASSSRESVLLRDLAFAFLRLGFTSVGGPAAHIANMEQEFVTRRQWLSREKFLDLLGVANLIPGPSSSELAIYIGHLLAGSRGLAVAGFCFILPAVGIVLLLAWVYDRYGALPVVYGILYGIKPVIIAIVSQAALTLGRSALKTRALLGVGSVALLLGGAGMNLVLVLLLSGVVSAWMRIKVLRGIVGVFTGSALFGSTPTLAAVIAKAPPSLLSIFLFFLKVGSFQFGSGYVLLAFLRTDLVSHWHWLTEAQLLDATAVGQFTPGPVFTTATFIGYLLRGVSGAGVATVGIFLPAFIFVGLSGPWIPRVRESKVAGAFLDGVNVASLALMVLVTVDLGKSALVDLSTGAIAIVSALILIRFRLNSVWLVLVGGFLGAVLKR